MKVNSFRKSLLPSLISIFIISLIVFPAAAQDQDRIVEKVTVTNVEVPVRVLHKNKPVDNLTKDDFIMYEDGNKVDINGFMVKRKTLRFTTDTATGETVQAGPAKPRTFVLVFNITDFNYSFQQAMDYLFTKVLRKGDRVLVLANDTVLEYPVVDDPEKIRTAVEDSLKAESKKARNRLSDYVRRVEGQLKMSRFRRELVPRPTRAGASNEDGKDQRSSRTGLDRIRELFNFLKKYLITWNEYKKRYLTPRVDRFYFFSRYLEKIKGEKWVLNFYQFEIFPRIRIGSSTMMKLKQRAAELFNSKDATANAQGRILDRLLNQLNMDLNVNRSFPNEEISKLFYKVDATFHSFFIKSNKASLSGDLEYSTLSSDIEMVLKGITDLTGGKNITSNNITQSLDQVREVEDVYYILTYAPKDKNKGGKLKIKVPGGKYDVLYDDNFNADYINAYFNKLEKKLKTPDIKVDGFSFSRKVLKFTIKDYLMRNVKSDKIGRIGIRIRLVNTATNKPLFDQKKVFDAKKKEFKISLGAFKRTPKGQYNFLIDARDMFTGKEANFHQNVTVKR